MAAVALAATALAPITAAVAAEADTDRFRNLNFRISEHFTETPDEDASKKQVKAFTKKANKLLNGAADVAPAEIETQVTTAVSALTADLEGAFDDPAVGQAVSEIDAWAIENCGYEVIETELVDYAFEGVPETLSVGKTVFNLTNTGTEPHEMLIVRIKSDATVEELLEDDERAERETQFVAAGFAEPGDTGTAYANLKKPSRYVAVCFIPTGSTGETEGSGPPHAAEGMVAEFEDEKADG